SEACDGELAGPVGVVDDSQSSEGKLIALVCCLEEESYHFVVVPVSESQLSLVPSPAGKDAPRASSVFEDVHERVVGEPWGRIEPYLFSEDLKLATVEMDVLDRVLVLLVCV